MAFRMPQPTTIVVSIIIAFAAIWLVNNVAALGKLVAPRVK